MKLMKSKIAFEHERNFHSASASELKFFSSSSAETSKLEKYTSEIKSSDSSHVFERKAKYKI